METPDNKYECVCGGKYTKTNCSKHKGSKIHTMWENMQAQIDNLNLQIYNIQCQYQQMINYYSSYQQSQNEKFKNQQS